MLLLIGGYLCIWPGEKILVVRISDFASSYERHMRLFGKKDLPLDEFILSKTEDRRTEVSGPAWSALADRLAKADREPDLRARRCGYSRDSFAFHLDEAPFNSLKRHPRFEYLSIDHGTAWLTVQAILPQETNGLPAGFSHPLRGAGLLMALCALPLYFVMPRRRFAADEIHYPRMRAVVLPDLLALCVAPVFSLLPFLIVWETAPGTSVLSVSRGWIWLTGAMWLMAALLLTLLAVGFKYSRLCYRLREDGLHEVVGRRTTLWPWADMETFQHYEKRTSSRLGKLLILFGGSLQNVGLGIALQGQNEYGIYVFDRNGRRLKIMANTLAPFDTIVDALKKHGVPQKRKTIG